MVESFKVCPICETPNQRNAAVCTTCGTSLMDVTLQSAEKQKVDAARFQYDYRYGETDLLEGSLGKTARNFTLGIIVFAVLICAGIIAISLAPRFLSSSETIFVAEDTPTPRPTLHVSTVTEGPPTLTLTFTPRPTDTPTITPTPEPCMQQVLPGDSLIAIIVRCGHTDRDVIDEVLEINGIEDAAFIQQGQTIIVPWPTASPDPNAASTEAAEEESSDTGSIESLDDLENIDLADSDVLLSLDTFDPFAPTATATLPPGVQWHVVESGENLTIIITQYGADVKVLSELNPELDFALCEFGQTYGGPECTVFLSVGQQIRVPAPTPTPTLSPTPSGSETPTPTPTATFNAPSAISPAEREFFNADELVTLRWIATAQLGENEVYRVVVEDTTLGVTYNADTTDLFYILPPDWRGIQELRHNYRWQIAIVNLDNPDDILYRTDTRTFVWQGVEPTAEGNA